ncbi:MAG TPA: shikimate kinase [Halomicronema sp.]
MSAGESRPVRDLLKGVNLYLIGMMGAGKTTVGRLLATQLNYRFVDTDEMIEKVVGKSITEIFAEEGETSFRELESKVLGEVAAYKNLVVATGGGIILRQENWGYLRHGVVVWLDVGVEQLYARVKEDKSRPLLQDPNPMAKLQSLLESRQSLYSQADVRVRVEGSQTPKQVAAVAFEDIRKALKTDRQQEAELN